MPNKKPTHNEITKALECCVNKLENFVSYCDGNGNIHEISIKNILDLINHQKAEIKLLKEINEALSNSIDMVKVKNIATLQAENERLQEINDSFTDIGKFYSEIKAETIKEFVERVDSMFAKIENELPKNKIVKETIQVYKDMLQIVKKEMVGE